MTITEVDFTSAAPSGDPLLRNNVTVSGDLTGPTIVFAHGFGCSQETWNEQGDRWVTNGALGSPNSSPWPAGSTISARTSQGGGMMGGGGRGVAGINMNCLATAELETPAQCNLAGWLAGYIITNSF